MPRHGSPYNHRYQQERRALLAQGLPCSLRLVCNGALADSADHDPPLTQHQHYPGSGCCVLRPACLRCQVAQGGLLNAQRWRVPQAPRPSRCW